MTQKVKPPRGDSDHLEDRIKIVPSIRSLWAHLHPGTGQYKSHQDAEYTSATLSLLSVFILANWEETIYEMTKGRRLR